MELSWEYSASVVSSSSLTPTGSSYGWAGSRLRARYCLWRRCLQKSKNSSSRVKFFLTMSLVAWKKGLLKFKIVFLWLIKCFIFCDKTSSSYLRHRGFVYIPVYPWEDLHLVWNNGHQLGLCGRDKEARDKCWELCICRTEHSWQ